MGSRRLLPALASSAVLLLACGQGGPATNHSVTLPPNDVAIIADADGAEFELGVGEAVRLAGRDLTVGFAGVGPDSRCPIDVLCVWQGDAEVRLVLGSASGRELESLHTTLDPRSLRRDGVVLEVIGLSPSPRSDRRIPADAYRVRLRARGT